MLAEDLQEQLRRATVALTATDGPAPLRGEDIFESNPDYPRSWDEFIGQSRVKARMRAAIASAKQRGARLDHTLIATGQSGAGKTALAKLVAFDMGAGLVEVSGKVTAEEARKTISGMQDGDVLLADEALALDTRIPTPSGWTTVGELAVGDTILSDTGAPTTVVRLTPIRATGSRYKVTFDDGTNVVTDAGHKWAASPKMKGGARYLKRRVVTTEDMFNSGRKWRIPASPVVELPEADLPFDPYIFGAWLGNGNKGQNYVNVRRCWAERTITEFNFRGVEAERISDAGPNVVRVRFGTIGTGGVRTIGGFRDRIGDDVYFDKHIPSEFLRGSVQQRLDLLRGLMDTDGYIHNNGYCIFSNNNERIIKSVIELLRSLGYRPTKTEAPRAGFDAKGKPYKMIWKVGFRAVPEMNPFLVREVSIKPRVQSSDLRIASIELIDSDAPVRCIEVSNESHLFLAGDFLVTHNCHQMGRRGSEWLLHLLQDGGFMTATGFQKMPDITVIAATTDAGVLPETVLNRFPVRPQFEAYTADEASQIAQQLAARTGITLDDDTAHLVARACRGSSRDMKALLIALRDAAFATEEGTFELALEWTGLTHDGLTRQMSDYLVTLVARCQGRAGLATIASIMGEPGPLHHTEKALMQLGYITIEPNGRKATAEGLKRVRELLGV